MGGLKQLIENEKILYLVNADNEIIIKVCFISILIDLVCIIVSYSEGALFAVESGINKYTAIC